MTEGASLDPLHWGVPHALENGYIRLLRLNQLLKKMNK